MTAALAFTCDRLFVGVFGGLVVRWLGTTSYLKSYLRIIELYHEYGILYRLLIIIIYLRHELKE